MKKRMFSLVLVMSMLLGMIVMPAAAADTVNDLEGACPCGCGQSLEQVNWQPWRANEEPEVTTGHYYLTGDYVQASQIKVNSGNRIVLDLRGYQVSISESRLILCYGYMAVLDSVGGGRLAGNTTGSGFGGVVMIATNETLNSVFELYGGTITLGPNHKGSRRGGLITIGETCTFRMYGGTLLGGTTYSKLSDHADTKDDGGAVYAASKSFVEILGGQIIGCKSDRYGGSIYSEGTTVLKNCKIVGGEAEKGGGNICQNGGSLTVENAVISDGACALADAYGGGNICAMSSARLQIKDSTIRNGYSAYHGGNIYMGSASAVIENTVIEAGVAGNRGNNVYGATSAKGMTLKNCQLPGDITYVGTNLTLEGLVKIGLLNDGLRIWYGDTARTINAAGLSAGSEIYVDAKGTFTEAGVPESYFKGAIRTVLSTSEAGLVATQAESGALGGYCPHCGERVVWTAFNKTNCLLQECYGDKAGDTDAACTNYHIADGHYYLTASDSSFRQHYVGAVVSEEVEGTKTNITKSSNDVVLDLAGYTLTSSGRAFYVREGGEGFAPSALTVMDTHGAGKLKGKGTADQGGGVLYGESDTQITVYGGTYQMVAGKAVRNGGIIYSGAFLKIYGGTFDASAYSNASYNGGAIYHSTGRTLDIAAGRFVGGSAKEGGTLYTSYNNTIKITGGQFAGGNAGTGGNLRFVGTSSYKTGTLNISGVSITGGHGTTTAGNLSATYYQQINVRNSYIAEGATDDYGGNIAVGTNSTFANYENLIVYAGTASRGANVYSAGTGARANFINCYVVDGKASTYGGNFCAANGRLVLQGGVYDHGTAGSYGGNFVVNVGKSGEGNYVKFQAKDGKPVQIVSGAAATHGGNLYINGVAELTGALVHNGKAKAQQGQDIWYLQKNGHLSFGLTIGEGLVGDISMGTVAENLGTPPYGAPIADTSCTTLKANITLENIDLQPSLTAKDGALYVGAVAVVDGENNATWYASNADAVAACDSNEYVKLYTDDPVTLTKDCAVDLNGHTVEVSGAYTLKGMDTVTNDGTDSQGKAILAAGTSFQADHAAPNGLRYLALSQGSEVTYHCLDMRITAVSLRPGNAGLYYNATWHMDSTLAASIESFGVAVSLNGMPGQNFMSDLTVAYTSQTKAEFVTGQEYQSAIVANILKQNASYNGQTGAAANDQRGQLPIHAAPYVILKNGEQVSCYVESSDNISYSLCDVLHQLCQLVDDKPEQYRRYTPKLREFYAKWKDNGISNWGLADTYAFGEVEEDDVIDVLMIGNSYCYYYVDELYEMAKAAGIKMRVCNLYYSGCPMNNHYTWWLSGSNKYQYFECYENGYIETKGVSLEWALAQQEWDVLSLQLGGVEMRSYTVEQALERNRTARTALYNYFKEQYPNADLYFHQTWAVEIGHVKDDGAWVMTDWNMQMEYTEKVRGMGTGICEENGVARINTGDAWELYRAACIEAGIDHNLCARLGKADANGDPHGGDGTHDGDIGGGQFLNAAVWYEILTGNDCRENSYVPTYTYGSETFTLEPAMITMLQDAAHTAVTELLPTYPENNP